MLKKVRLGVSVDTQGDQIPWENGSLMGDFCFADCAGAVESQAEQNLMVAEERIRQLERERQAQVVQPPIGGEQGDAERGNDEVPPPLEKRKIHRVSKTKPDFGIEMVNIPGGTFQMGCGPHDGKCETNEKPRRRVTVPAFAMAKTEITQGQWKAVIGSNPSYFKNCGDDCPVESVSWNDAQSFINILNRKTGGHYRLPSEAEWEYACRAEQDTLYCGGDDVEAVAWYGLENSGKTTHPVGGKQPNAFGLFDLTGSVWEWVEDCWHGSYQEAPGDGSAWDGGTECAHKYRVARGGSWVVGPRSLRSAFRYRGVTGGADLSQGFRLARGF